METKIKRSRMKHLLLLTLTSFLFSCGSSENKSITNDINIKDVDTALQILEEYIEPKEPIATDPIDNNKVITIKNCCSFTLPDDLEVQSGSWKKFNDYTAKKLGLEYLSDKLWLQQKGLNSNEEGSRDSYIRLSFKYMDLPENTHLNPTENPNLNSQDLADLDQMFDSEIVNYKLTKIQKIEKSIVEKIGNYYAVKKTYTSKMSDSPIKNSERYLIFNNSKGYVIEVEYWLPDYKKYKHSIDQVFKSLELL